MRKGVLILTLGRIALFKKLYKVKSSSKLIEGVDIDLLSKTLAANLAFLNPIFNSNFAIIEKDYYHLFLKNGD